jgi:hypothetical protein
MTPGAAVTLTALVPVFTRPTCSAICFGLLPAAWTSVGRSMSLCIGELSSSRDAVILA